MAHTKRFLLGSKSNKRKNSILIHRNTDQFKEIVRLVREAHARAASKQEQPVELVGA